jgi:formamidopyrimidine-DNA glycosylase
MPELPELSVVRDVLHRRLLGQIIESAQVIPPGGPIVIRDLTGVGFAKTLTGARFGSVARRGKFLVFSLSGAGVQLNAPTLARGDESDGPTVFLIINPKLTGRLQLCAPKDKKAGPVHAVLHLSGGQELRYIDQKKMGQVFLSKQPPDDAAASGKIADYAGMGPEALEISREEFKARLRPFRGEIKGILTRGDFVAGIGNAYADEVLWTARLHPYRKKTSLTAEELDRLYDGMRACLLEAIEKVRAEMGENIHLKPRDFLNVHMKTGEPCPRCGTPISLVGANQRITNFCRQCQPGGLIKGM